MSVMKEAKAPGGGFASELQLPRLAAIAALVVLALAIQSALLPQATLLGVIPQILLVVIVSLAYVDGPRVGIVTGFAGGLLLDLQLPGSIVGLTPLIYVAIAYAVGNLRELAPPDSVWTPVLIVAGASAVAELSYAGLSIILGEPWVGLIFTLKVVGLVVLYDTLLTPFVFPLVRKVADRFRPERIIRW